MEVINTRHHAIKKNERVVLSSYVRFDESGKFIYFSAGAADEFGLQAGLSINFVNDDNLWFFYCDNNTDGFPLTERKGKKAVLLCNASLVNLFIKRTRCSLPCKFPLIELKARHQGHPLIKIDLHNPIEL